MRVVSWRWRFGDDLDGRGMVRTDVVLELGLVPEPQLAVGAVMDVRHGEIVPALRGRNTAGPRSAEAGDRLPRGVTMAPMGVFDKAKQTAEQVKEVTEEKADKLGPVIDDIAEKVDEKTGGKHSDKIDRAVDAIQNPADTPGEERPSSPAQ